MLSSTPCRNPFLHFPPAILPPFYILPTPQRSSTPEEWKQYLCDEDPDEDVAPAKRGQVLDERYGEDEEGRYCHMVADRKRSRTKTRKRARIMVSEDSTRSGEQQYCGREWLEWPRSGGYRQLSMAHHPFLPSTPPAQNQLMPTPQSVVCPQSLFKPAETGRRLHVTPVLPPAGAAAGPQPYRGQQRQEQGPPPLSLGPQFASPILPSQREPTPPGQRARHRPPSATYQYALQHQHHHPILPSNTTSVSPQPPQLRPPPPTVSTCLSQIDSPRRHSAPNLIPLTTATSSSTSSTASLHPLSALPHEKRRGRHVARACQHCKKAHLACDEQRPCKRCVRLGKTDCRDVEHKRRGRPRSKRDGEGEAVRRHSIPGAGLVGGVGKGKRGRGKKNKAGTPSPDETPAHSQPLTQTQPLLLHYPHTRAQSSVSPASTLSSPSPNPGDHRRHSHAALRTLQPGTAHSHSRPSAAATSASATNTTSGTLSFGRRASASVVGSRSLPAPPDLSVRPVPVAPSHGGVWNAQPLVQAHLQPFILNTQPSSARHAFAAIASAATPSGSSSSSGTPLRF